MTMEFSKERAYMKAQMPIAKARAFARIKSDKMYVRFGVSSAEVNEANMLMAYAGRRAIENAKEVAIALSGLRNRPQNQGYDDLAVPPPKTQAADTQQKGK